MSRGELSITESLPPEIFHKICDSLPTHMLLIAAMVCRNWRILIIQYPYWGIRGYENYFFHRPSFYQKLIPSDLSLTLQSVYNLPADIDAKSLIIEIKKQHPITRNDLFKNISSLIGLVQFGFSLQIIELCQPGYYSVTLIHSQKEHVKKIVELCGYQFLEKMHPMQLKHIFESAALIVEMLESGLPKEAINFAQQGPNNFYPLMHQNHIALIKLWTVYDLPNWGKTLITHHTHRGLHHLFRGPSSVLNDSHPVQQEFFVKFSKSLCKLADEGISCTILFKYGGKSANDGRSNINLDAVRNFSALIKKRNIPDKMLPLLPTLHSKEEINQLDEILEMKIPIVAFNLCSGTHNEGFSLLYQYKENLKLLLLDHKINLEELLRKHPIEQGAILRDPYLLLKAKVPTDKSVAYK